jgi:hypothetical protein
VLCIPLQLAPTGEYESELFQILVEIQDSHHAANPRIAVAHDENETHFLKLKY